MATVAIDIRRLTYADLPQVIAIERRAFPTPWSLAMFVLEISKPSGVCLAAWEGERIVGYTICSRYDVVWHIMNVAVDPAQRRRHIGTSLIEEIIARVDDADARYTLEVRVSNHPAIRLYEGFGFLSAGMRRRYYQDNGEDALIMWRTPMTLQGSLDDVPNAGPVTPVAGHKPQVILAIETSCDDTCAAVVDDAGAIRSNVISSQEIHDAYGGVVPEVASRQHLELTNVVVDDALRRADASLDALDAIAVTQGPGLVGALLVGVATAKGLAAARGLPLIAVDHLQGHVAANFLAPDPLEPPFVCLIASGGHTFLAHVTEHDGFEVLGRTLDDAAGEAFDKGARLLGLPYPGGPHLERVARDGDPRAFDFPTARGVPGLDFSFSGLKTALLYAVRDLGEQDAVARRADLAASYQEAIVTALAQRTTRALEQTGLDRLAIGGGVAANGPLRERLSTLAGTVKVPDRALCTDNAAMIASAARHTQPLAYPDYLGLDAYATNRRAL